MSLDWDLTNIKDNETVCWIPDPTDDMPDAVSMNPVTEALIWATLAVDIGRLTEENLDEFAYRLHFWERMFSPYLIENGKGREMTYKEIKAHVGLSTNVMNISRAQWMKKNTRSIEREYGWQANAWLDKSKRELEIPV